VGTLNYARGSALRTNTATTELTYIPFARDAVTIAFNAASDFPRDVTLGVAGQATNQFTLRNIYLGTVTSFFDSTGNTITIRPILPQQLSGTREYWVLTALGTTEDLIAAGGRATDIGNTVQEHDGRFLTGPGDIVPFSVAQWVAQSNSSAAGLPAGVVPTPTGAFDRRGQAILGAIDTVVPLINVGNGTETNPDFLPSRIVYNIVATAALTTANPTATDTLIRQTFAGPTSLICQNAGVIRAYGFATISNCGNTSAQRGYVN